MLPGALLDAVAEAGRRNSDYLIIENQQGVQRVPIRLVTNIWKEGKYAHLMTADGKEYRIREPLKKLMEQLPENEFIWAERGGIVNLSQVLRVDKDYLIMRGGGKVFLSEKGKRIVKRQAVTSMKRFYFCW